MVDNRIEWIDIAKGIGIILVIIGHTFCLGYIYPLYAFHMPLFFFLSGLLFRDKREGFLSFFKSKTTAIIRPWFVILLISLFVCLAIPQWRNEMTLDKVISDLYTANTNVFQNSSLWYLVCFYFVLLLFYFVNKIKINVIVLLLFVILAICLLWIKDLLDLTNIPYHRLPFKIDSALIALFFFLLAYRQKERINKMLSNQYNQIIVVLFVVLTISLCVLNGFSNINSLEFGRIRLLYYPIAIMGIGVVVYISRCISVSGFIKLRKFLSYYGKNSLLIFGFQSLLIRLYLLFFNYLEGTNMKLYDNNPMIHQVGSFVVVTIVLSPIVVSLFSSLRKLGFKIL